MALYIPAGRRRRRLVLCTVGALGAGLVVGALLGRVTAPTVEDRLSSVRDDARATAAGLRVIAIHDESRTLGERAGDRGADLVLRDTRSQLRGEFDDAPWITLARREALFKALDALEGQSDKTSAAFGRDAETLAKQIESTFGVTN